MRPIGDVMAGCPEWAVGGVRRYLEHGIEPGSGLRAILEGDLYAAVRRVPVADIGALAAWVWAALPIGCYGSRAVVDAWMVRRRAASEAARIDVAESGRAPM